MGKINDDVMPSSSVVLETIMTPVLEPILEPIEPIEPTIVLDSTIVLQPTMFTEHKKFTSVKGTSVTGTSVRDKRKRNNDKTNNDKTNNVIKKKGINLYCYNKNTNDARCCGICYCIYSNQVHEKQCNICPNNFYDYWNSGYIQTNDGPGSKSDGICCWLCFPIKFGYFFSCCLGSICNGCINSIRDTDVNYLC